MCRPIRTVAVRLVACSLALGGLWLARTQQQPEPLTIERVKGDLHVIIGPGGNIGVLPTPEGVILVDDKFERNVPAILEKVAEITDQPVRYVLNTHHHGDHSGGNAALMGRSAEIVLHENAQANMERGGQPGVPHLAFSEMTTLKLGGQEVRAIHYGAGHTSGDAVVYYPGLAVVQTGDLFVRGAPFIDYNNGGSGVDWDQTLDGVLQLEFETVIPGHGPVGVRDDLVEWKESFETFRGEVDKLSREGVSLEVAAERIAPLELPGWGPTPLKFRALEGLLQELR